MNQRIQAFSKLFLVPAIRQIKRLEIQSFGPFLKIFLVFVLVSLIGQPARRLSAQGKGDTPFLLPENARFNHLTTQDGLAHNHVTSILQDRFGFMWFGTESGLNRYDGYRFLRFHNDPDNETSLSSNNVSAIIEGPKGYIWAATEDGGLNRIDPASDPESGQVVRYINDPENPESLSQDNVDSLAFDQAGILWIGTGRGILNRFDPQTETFKRYEPPTIEANPVAIESIFVRPDGTLWIGGEALFLFDPDTETFTPYAVNAKMGAGPPVNPGNQNGAPPLDGAPPPGNPPPNDAPPGPGAAPSNHVNAVFEDENGRVWIASSSLFLLEPPSRQMTLFDLPEGQRTPFLDIMQDGGGRLWLAAQNGIHIFDPETEQYVQIYRAEPTDPESLSGNSITTFFQSPEQLVWIGSTTGINLFAWQQSPFTAYLPDRNPVTFANSNVHTIAIGPDGDLWFAGGPILSHIDREGGVVKVDRLTVGVSGNISQLILGITHISFDSQGNLWVDEIRGVGRVDPETFELEVFPLPDSETELIIDMRTDPDGSLWIVTPTFLHHFDRNDGRYTDRYEYLPPDNAALQNLSVETLRVDSGGIVWMSGAGFLISFNPQTEAFKYYLHNNEDPNSMSRGQMTAVYRDPGGKLWFTTESGLLTLDEASGEFERYTEADGLPSDGIMGILPDEAGNLWLSTFLGLSLFNIEEETFRNFNQDEGLPFDEFINGSFYKSADGELIFGGRGGLVAFYPDEITENPYQPPVVITEMRLGNTPVFVGQENGILSTPIWDTDELILNHDQDIVAFDFAALSYTSPQQNRYRYSLEGLEEEWINGGTDLRSARYTTLPPGHYTLRVQGTNNDGLWSEERVVRITVRPPWWETIWFRGLILLLVAGLLISGYRWRVYSIRRRNQELEVEVSARTQELAESNQQLLEAKETAEVASNAKSTFLSSMSHELRTPLNGVLGYAQILKRDRNLTTHQAEGVQVIYESGQHLLTLINDVLDLAKVEAGKLELLPTAFRLRPFLDGITAVSRMSAQQKDVRFAYEPDPNLPAEVEADEKRLRQVLLNLLGNAVKFTDSGTVTLRVINQSAKASSPKEACLRIEIEDSGVGMAADQLEKIFQPFEQVGDKQKQTAGTGLGLPISQQLVALMGSQIKVSSTSGQGSLFWFELSLPIVVVKQESERPLANTITGYDGPRRRILVADDRLENRMVLLNLLEPLGFEIILASDGREALELTREVQPDLLLIDLVMPEMTGFETVQAIREIAPIQEMPIIAISASVFAMDQARSRMAGCDAFLPKPVEADRLLGHIENLLGLTWHYLAPAEAVVEPKTAEPDEALILPPLDQLEVLFELATLGKISQIQEQINHLETTNTLYGPFVRKIRRLADAFEDQQIANFLRQSLDMEPPAG